MPRHESITDEYVAELESRFNQVAQQVKAGPDWAETQKRMITLTYPYKIALERVNEGWSREEIRAELEVRTGFARVPNPIIVIGGNQIDE